MDNKLAPDKKTQTFTSFSLPIHKIISICGDEIEKRVWDKYFEDKKASDSIKQWIIEDYKKMGYSIDVFTDIFTEDEDWSLVLDMAVKKMFMKLNKHIHPELNLKSKQEYFKFKVHEYAKK